jgi:hypothetical protein
MAQNLKSYISVEATANDRDSVISDGLVGKLRV